MASSEYKVPTYPVVSFLVKRGHVLAGVLGALPLLAALYLAITGWGPLIVVAGLLASVVTTGLFVSYVEVLRVIADTLMPK
ncbi:MULTISPECIES: hypothetical protein [Xanthobacter]|uniref:hypothetical protein n=1 Tax=Xanthobacter TaxID=279 RepID=UPI0032B483BC